MRNITRMVPNTVPRHVRNLNALASREGMNTRVDIAPDGYELRLWSIWKGTKEQLFATGLVPLFQQRLMLLRASYQLMTPMDDRNHIACGRMKINGDQIEWTIDSGPAVFSVEHRDDLEIVTYADETLYHGTTDALIAAGIDRKRLPAGKTCARSDFSWAVGNRRWRSRRQPDSLIVYAIETEASVSARERAWEEARQKEAEEDRRRAESWYRETAPPSAQAAVASPRASHLRLVVDNTARG